MRDNFERETQRVRDELNKQLERLRLNMSSMLQQGDQDSSVLQLQNSLLFNDLKMAQDECDAIKRTLALAEEHESYLRKELQAAQDDTKVALNEAKELRQQVYTLYTHKYIQL
jgi:chromosome segregation ATPase